MHLVPAPAEHEGKPFFEKLVAFLSSGAVVATVWEGPEVIAAIQMKFGEPRCMAMHRWHVGAWLCMIAKLPSGMNPCQPCACAHRT